MKTEPEIYIELFSVPRRNQPGMRMLFSNSTYVDQVIELLNADRKHVSNIVSPGLTTQIWSPTSTDAKRTLESHKYEIRLHSGFYVRKYADTLAETLKTNLGCVVEVREVES